jgi:hypothetical protein
MEGQAFCEICGEQLKKGVERREAIPSMGAEIGVQHRKHIRSARFAIMFVAVVTIGVSIFFWFKLQDEIGTIPAALIDGAVQKAIAFQKVAIASTFFLGLVFIGLFFWAKKNPFGASLTALIIYATSILVQAGMEPATLAKGIIIKVIIVLALVRGVQAGLAYKKLGALD